MSTPDFRDSRRPPRGRGRRTTHRPRGPRAVQPAPTFWQKIIAFFTGRRARGTGGNSPARQNGTRPHGGAGRPETVEVSTPKLYVGNLSYEVVEGDLFELFNGVGTVRAAEIVTHKHTEKSKGFAFVLMQTTAEAKRAVAELHDREFLGRRLVVSGAKINDARDAR